MFGYSTVYVDCSPAFNGTICIIAVVTWPGQKPTNV